MNAQQMLLDYASKKNDGKLGMTNEQWLGKAITEGIVIDRQPASRIVCNIRREGKTIIVTETLKEERVAKVNGKLEHNIVETATEIFRVNV